MKKLKIAIGATLHKKINENSTGGTEIFAYLLISELVKRGHEVSIFSSADSSFPGKKIGFGNEQDINRVEQGQKLFHGYQLFETSNIISQQNNFDVIHINYFEPFLFTPFSQLVNKPLIYTVHSDLYESELWQKFTLTTVKNSDVFVFVSGSAADRAALLGNKKYIYNGIDISQFSFSSTHDGYLLWLGRIRRKKGIKEAVEAAIQSGERLIISGVIDNKEEESFYENEVKPLINSNKNIDFIGPVDLAKKISLYQKAKAFLFPVTWEEPFGLTMIESMACGTPVIGFNRGAVPEIVKDGFNGFIIENVTQMVDKIKTVGQIDRNNCRKTVETNFTIEKMVDNYEKLYYSLQ